MLFKNLAKPQPRLVQRSTIRRQTVVLFIATLLFFLIFGGFLFRHHEDPQPKHRPSATSATKELSLQETRIQVKPLAVEDQQNFRILMPASNSGIDMCQTLLTTSILGYPAPTLIAFNETANLVANQTYGSIVASDHDRINGVLAWLNELPVTANNDLILVMDPDDIWFQLRPETLIRRYRAINDRANDDLKALLGSAFDKESLRQTVVFGANKRCSPNSPNSVACYSIPDSPVPNDVYGDNTDTIIGYTRYASQRPRYLDAGYMMGPVGDVRAIFKRAADKAKAMSERKDVKGEAEMSASAMLDSPYYDSYQHIFQEIFGEQEFQREVMRRRHLSISAKAKGQGTSKPTYIEGTLVSDRLKPSFTHESMEPKSGKPDEFGIGIDYWSDLGQQTANSDHDARWLTYNRPIAEQASQRSGLDCRSVASGALPRDILDASLPRAAVSDASQFSPKKGWDEIAMLTNLCFDTIPVIIHHTSGKKSRDDMWPQLWMQPHARRLMEEVLARESGKATSVDEDDAATKGGKGEKGEGRVGGAYTQSGKHVSWNKLCPSWMEPELYRDTVADA
jgi:hypothetical protein